MKPTQRLDPERVGEALERVFARPEFREQVDPLTRLLRWLGNLFGATDGTGAHRLGYWLFVVLLGLLLGALAAFVLTSLSRGTRRNRPAPQGTPGPALAERVADLRRRARSAAEAGDLLLALRLAFFALVVGLGERGDLAYRDAWTNRELLERGEPGPPVRGLLAPLVEELDRKGFGREPTTRADVERLEALCDRWLGATT